MPKHCQGGIMVAWDETIPGSVLMRRDFGWSRVCAQACALPCLFTRTGIGSLSNFISHPKEHPLLFASACNQIPVFGVSVAMESRQEERGGCTPNGKITSVCFQVSIRLDGENKAVEYNAVGLTKDAVRVVFRSARVSDLFDRSWHKIALSIQSTAVSLYIDCKLVQMLPIEDRENIDIQGKTVIGKRLYDSVPIDVSTARIE